LSQLVAPHGVYFVAGNHEQFGDDSKYLHAIVAAGVRVLTNEKVEVDGLQIVGVPYRNAAQGCRENRQQNSEFRAYHGQSGNNRQNRTRDRLGVGGFRGQVTRDSAGDLQRDLLTPTEEHPGHLSSARER
jgi:predicted MPP superfamily phosphohydrolase